MSLQHLMLHLSLIENIGPSLVQDFVKKLGLDRLSQIYTFTQVDFQSFGFSEKKSQDLVVGLQDQSLLQKELELMGQLKVGIVTFLCPEYPELLKEIHVPPTVLYYQGDVGLFAHRNKIACVGSRKSHRYVHEALVHLVVPMLQRGWVVVSGGALGADTFAHQIALQHNSPTIVVVGSGLCHQYPPQNKKLFQQVVEQGGLIVSSFPMQMMPHAWCFPVRNRLISGLSRGCIVLQAEAKSGALITAECAMQQGREVFALPGSIFDPLSAGCHDLIQQGAKLIASVQDILVELEYDGQSIDQQTLQGNQNFQQELFSGVLQRSDQYDSVAQEILQIAVLPVTADMLIAKMGIGLAALQDKLFELSLDGKISQDAMGFWKRV